MKKIARSVIKSVDIAATTEKVYAFLLRCSPSFGPKFSLLKVDRCLQYIIDRSLLLGLWEL